MLRVRPTTLVALLAWIVMVTPWQRCRSECQDVLATSLGHACHSEDAHPSCPAHHERHEHPGSPCEDDTDCDHQPGEHQNVVVTMACPRSANDPGTDLEVVAWQARSPRIDDMPGVNPLEAANQRPPPRRLVELRSVVLLL